ncbi:nucleotidyltransferase family protein [Pseudomonas sp. X10]
MNDHEQLQAIIQSDPQRWQMLAHVRALGLPDCWIGAGFVRNAVWDHLHGRAPAVPGGDVDVLWFDPGRTDAAEDQRLEAELLARAPGVDWSVKNQARMHLRNGDAPYGSTGEAMSHWPETATAVAVRRTAADQCEVLAPLGLEDLFELVLRPTRRFVSQKREVYEERIRSKGWLSRWPGLQRLG